MTLREAVFTPASGRLTSLDQFRGYTMVGMLLVNYIGNYQVCPKLLKHSHDYCSYADTIMPHFLFAAGFAMRLTLGKRLLSGDRSVWQRAARRIVGLALIAIVWYAFCDLSSIIHMFRTQDAAGVLGTLGKRHLFQTLLHIAATSLWILPVIIAPPKVRILYGCGSAVLHTLLSGCFNFQWVNTPPMGIDGGPLGFLTWAVPAILGTLACDIVKSTGAVSVGRLAGWGLSVMLFGWLLSTPSVLYNTAANQVVSSEHEKLASDSVIPVWSRLMNWRGTVVEPPFVPPPDLTKRQWNYWMMSQRSGSLSYTAFAGGLSMLVFSFFLWICDGHKLQLDIFRTLGTNSLAAYLLHDVASWVISPWFPTDGSISTVLLGYVCFTAFVYGICRLLEAKSWYLRV